MNITEIKSKEQRTRNNQTNKWKTKIYTVQTEKERQKENRQFEQKENIKEKGKITKQERREQWNKCGDGKKQRIINKMDTTNIKWKQS